MASLNTVILLGNLTRDPEVRYTPTGLAVATFGLAINHRYGPGDDRKEETCFVDVVAFGRQAEPIGEYLQKGSPALVDGRLRWRTWETADGQRRSKHEVLAERVQFLASPATMRDGSRAADAAPDEPPYDEEDVPF